MSSPNDAARAALLVAIDVWADARDAFTLAQMDERVRPSEQTRERTGRAGADVKRERVLMLEAVDAYADECKRAGAAELAEVQERRAASTLRTLKLDPALPCWGCEHALCSHTIGELGDECTECQCTGFETAPAEPAECELCEQEAELEPGTFTPHEHAPATVKP